MLTTPEWAKTLEGCMTFTSEPTIEIVNKSPNILPEYSTKDSAGMDLRADFSRIKLENTKPLGLFFDADSVCIIDNKMRTLEIKPGGRALIPTGLHIALPAGFEAQVRPRSGMAINQGITVLNTPGTIDADYRGEIGVILLNTSKESVRINQNDRIAQLVINRYSRAIWNLVDELGNTERGEGGFGHTGVK